MRHGPVLGGLLGVVAVSPLLAIADAAGAGASSPRSGGNPAAPLTAAHPGPAAAHPGSTVVYRGLRVPVPPGWRVYDLEREPGRCLRYDHRAIYLGTPGARADCPSRLIGGEDVLHIEPSTSVPIASRAARGRTRATLAHYAVRPTTGHEVRVPLPEAGVTINGRYGTDTIGIQKLIRSMNLTGTGAHRLPPQPHKGRPEIQDREESRPRPWVKGKGFDTCTAPAVSSMRAWRRAYKVSNAYIGGPSRGCAQPNLTRTWVKSVRRMGYRLIPTYVGPQAPCTRYRLRFSARKAASEGKKAAADAVRAAKALGIPKGKPIYYNMEAYRTGDAACRKAVLAFLHHWSVKLKALKYVSGVYGSVGSAIRDLANAKDIRRPSAIWFAHWDGKPAYGHPYIPSDLWRPHRRIKQYRGGHKETHGGVTINIDSNQVDGRVY
jgi:hypothetical protein